jgi:phage-related protein
MYRAIQFETGSGKRPMEKFFDKLSRTVMAKIVQMMELLEENGSDLGMPYSKKITNNLFELRVVGKDSIRILYTSLGRKIIFLHGFKKKTWKIPKKEIEIAQNRLANL